MVGSVVGVVVVGSEDGDDVGCAEGRKVGDWDGFTVGLAELGSDVGYMVG